MNYLTDSITRHEGFKPYPYLDSKGIPTIGIGRAFPGMTLEQVQAIFPGGCTYEEAVGWMTSSLEIYRKDAWAAVSCFDELDPVRQDVLTELCYNIGAKRLAGFRKMLEALNLGRYGESSIELCDSKWWDDVRPRRALHMAYQLVSGQPWQLAFP